MKFYKGKPRKNGDVGPILARHAWLQFVHWLAMFTSYLALTGGLFVNSRQCAAKPGDPGGWQSPGGVGNFNQTGE
ncbi:MAG: hypothetical protein ACYCZ6_09535 [Polaromonas sp.]